MHIKECVRASKMRVRRSTAFVCFAVSMLCHSLAPLAAAQTDDALAAGFRVVPDAAKPRVWWHWMNGNVTAEGVRLDLEWMKRVGIGGVHNFDADLDATIHVQQPLAFLTPEWREAKYRSARLADELGLEFTVSSSAGWSATGGPWIEPHQAMKKLVWSETLVQGGVPFKGRLVTPPNTTGLFQNIPFLDRRAVASSADATYYADIATIAYRMPDTELPFVALQPMVTSSAGPIDASLLWDGDLATPVTLPFGEEGPAWLQLSFANPQRVQAITIALRPALGLNPVAESRQRGWLEASDDGQAFRKIVDLPQNGAPQRTVAFSPVVARVFRVMLDRPEPGAAEQLGLRAPPSRHEITQLLLHTAARVNRFEDKAGYSTRQILEEDDTPPAAESDVIRKSAIVDLTQRMRADGSLDWMPPEGRWTVLRFGYSLIGRINHPAPRAGTGLEVDKLNRAHVKAYMDAYLDQYEKTLGAALIGAHGLQYLLMDSFEAGAQNWTDDMLEQFSRRRGYDALPWLAVLTGRVVDSAAASDRFLWDFRKTIGELMAERYYSQISASLRERALGSYMESHEFGRAFIGDGMDAKKTADVPMGAMWAGRVPAARPENYDADIRESASVAHIYGQNLVAGEAFTHYGNPYGFAPEQLKPVADRMLAMGLNRFVIHTSVHQPDSRVGPGLALGPFGQWFTRKETWAEQAAGWISYLARSSYLLQQGRFVADIAYLYGEDTNVTSLFATRTAPVPAGYNLDFISSATLINELSTREGRLVTRGGMEYRVLMLDASTRRMSVPVLRKIRELVRAGAIVIGNRPSATPSLADDEDEFRALVADLWPETPGAHAVIASHRSFGDALSSAGVLPDAIFVNATAAELRFVHRTWQDGELYFISNGTGKVQAIEASLRVSGRQPELWRADTAAMRALSYRMVDGRTIVPLQLAPNDAVFIVFRQPTREQRRVVPEPATRLLTTLEGPWKVSFPPERGAPAHVQFERLHSWTESAEPGVKYFSGTAAYAKTVRISPEWLDAGTHIELDLGSVKNVAEVLVNGTAVGFAWQAPFKLDVSDALRAGDNLIEIKVTNLWPNRLIGDKQAGAQRIAFASFDPFGADSPLLASGLIGPVTLLSVAAPPREASGE